MVKSLLQINHILLINHYCKTTAMDLEKFVKNRQMGEGRTRVINSKGEVIA